MKLGIVGTGAIVQEVLPHFRDWGIEPAGLCGTERSRDVVAELCAANEIPFGTSSYAEFLANASFDTVYIAVPNHLHFEMSKMALEAGKNVIVEKPMTSNAREARELADLALSKDLYFFEAISTIHHPNFRMLRAKLGLIGKVKMIVCNFSQYSHRYDAFLAGELPPVFDPAKSGGVLMDLNVYNVHYVVRLFGPPRTVNYSPNLTRGIDTSGVLVLEYDDFKAICIGAKDCQAPSSCLIEGSEGFIEQSSPANACGPAEVHYSRCLFSIVDYPVEHRMQPEFMYFKKVITSNNRESFLTDLAHSLSVSEVLTEARLKAGICFPADGDREE